MNTTHIGNETHKVLQDRPQNSNAFQKTEIKYIHILYGSDIYRRLFPPRKKKIQKGIFFFNITILTFQKKELHLLFVFFYSVVKTGFHKYQFLRKQLRVIKSEL